jgi:hypothetical protein
MKTIRDAWKEMGRWRTEPVWGENNRLRLYPFVEGVYPLIASTIGNTECLTDIETNYVSEFKIAGVCAGRRRYKDKFCREIGVAHVFFDFNEEKGEIGQYFSPWLEFDLRDKNPFFYAKISNLEMSQQEKEEAMQLLRRADLLPEDVRLRIEKQDMARILRRAIEGCDFRGETDLFARAIKERNLGGV